MRKKKFLLLKYICMLLIVVVIGGCKSNTDTQEFVKASISPENIVSINLHIKDFYGFIPEKQNEERTSFTKILKERYGIDLIVSGIGNQNINRELVEGFDGLIKVNRSVFLNWIESNTIAPLGEILENNVTWNSLPWYFKDNGIINGELWGIPANTLTNLNYFSRFIRRDWLDVLNLDSPKTTEEYYECMRAIVYNDPDGNGINDTTGFSSLKLSGLVDIFNSYDCRMSRHNEYLLAWDPNDNKFVDGLRSKHIEECLQYLNSCYKEGLLQSSFNTITQSEYLSEYYRGKTGSLSHFISYYDDIEKHTGIKHDVIMALEGKIKKNITPVFYECNEYYMLSAATKNKNEVINKFVNVFLGDEVGYFMGVYGLPDTSTKVRDFTIDGENIILNFEIEDNRLKNRQYPNILIGHPVYSRYEVIYSNAANNSNIINVKSNFDKNITWDLYSEYEDLLYLVNDKYRLTFKGNYYFGSKITEREVKKIGTKLIMDSIMGKVNISDALEEYEEWVSITGLDHVLTRVNLDINNGRY